ncbi:glycerophosphodiester phosphodiesterase family protein [Tautonia rosea]|uniref:glycerophosphodiester phosphodiesterase family protein n=1 Tax=Tautonia rosea TaxID=2728037 RepID=UPI0014763B98|nr:glycerophosphodiester phosphodiesterase family protein [Tautonia rosea]
MRMTPKISSRKLLYQVLGDFGRSFAPLVGYEILYRLAAFVLIAPASAWLLRSLIGMTGRYAVGNVELIAFAFSPVGLAFVLTVGILTVFNLFFQHAGVILIADAKLRGRHLSPFGTFMRVILNFPRMLHLGVLQIIRYATVVLPILLVVGLAYWFLWSGADLYFLTQVRPPQFWLGVIVAGLTIAVGSVIIVRMILQWLVSLPLVLVEGRSAEDALRTSKQQTSGQMVRNLNLLIVSTLAIALLGVVVAALFEGISSRVLNLVPGRLDFTIPALAGLLGTHFLLFEAVEITGSILVGLVIFRIAHESGLVQPYRGPPGISDDKTLLKPSKRRQLVRKILLGVLLLAVISALASLGLLATVGVTPTVTITAHRGGAHDAPENTLAAIRSAIASGADAAEIDVQLTADGKVVVFHDEDLMRLAGDPRRLSDLTFDEARTFDVGSWFGPEFQGERIPTLDEVIDEAGNRLKLNIELKLTRTQSDPEPLVRAVLDTINVKQAQQRCYISTLSYPALVEVRRQNPDMRVGFIVFEAVGDPTRLDLDFLSVRDVLATDDFIARARRRNRTVHVWSVSDPNQFVTFVNRGVEDIITSKPALMVDRRSELEELNDLERLLLWYQRFLSDR